MLCFGSVWCGLWLVGCGDVVEKCCVIGCGDWYFLGWCCLCVGGYLLVFVVVLGDFC